jgi:hypothetical protein
MWIGGCLVGRGVERARWVKAARWHHDPQPGDGVWLGKRLYGVTLLADMALVDDGPETRWPMGFMDFPNDMLNLHVLDDPPRKPTMWHVPEGMSPLDETYQKPSTNLDVTKPVMTGLYESSGAKPLPPGTPYGIHHPVAEGVYRGNDFLTPPRTVYAYDHRISDADIEHATKAVQAEKVQRYGPDDIVLPPGIV